MGRHTFLWILAGTLVALAAGILIPAQFHDPQPIRQQLPWQVERTPSGTIQVFGITLGETPLREVARRLREEPEVSLFRSPDGEELALEAFFERVTLGGLSAKMVATFDLSDETLEGMFKRGLRISSLGSGTRKVTLAPDDMEQVWETPVAALTYLPSVHLKPEVLESRFGHPAHRIPDPEDEEGGAVHWLYPHKGVDVAVSEEKKEVIQYIQPDHFDETMAPLLEAGSEAGPQ